VDPVRRELDEYFDGKRRVFDLRVDLRPLPPFQQLVLGELALVPYGRTETYGGLAARIGRQGAARAVGGALNRNPIPIVLPCHRVVGAGSRLVGYAGGLERKRTLLALEGAALDLKD
jgi:O-6-methylguanine DNA methyltransferase